MKIALRQKIRDLSLKQKLFYANTIFIIVLVLAIGLLTYNQAFDQVEQRQKVILLQNLKQDVALLDFNLDNYQRKTDIIFSNTIIQNALVAQYQDFAEVYDAYQNKIYKELEPVIQDLLYSSTISNQQGNDPVKVIFYINNQSLVRNSGIIASMEDIKGQAWLQNLYQSPGEVYWRGLFSSNHVEYFSINRALKSFIDLKDIGVLTIMIPASRIAGLFSQNNENVSGELLLFDQDNNLIQLTNTNSLDQNALQSVSNQFSSSKERVMDTTVGGKAYIFAKETSSSTGWTIVSLLPYSVLTDSVRPIQIATLYILVIGVIVCIIFTYIIAHLTTRRLNGITQKMNRMKSYWNEPLLVIPGTDEIGQLDSTFNELIAALKSMAEQKVKLSMQKASLQVELLQSQINPHLLYNTLATINWKAKKAEAWDIYEATDSLIRFYRRFLNKGEMISSFRDEIEIIKENIKILKFTYNLDFDEQIGIQDEVLDCASLHLVLQPVVENAIVHGIRPSTRKGCLVITGEILDGRIHFIINDNGIGIKPELVEAINQSSVISKTDYPGYGLLNVKKRISLYYGEEFGFSVKSVIGEGTEVDLVLPAFTRFELEQKIASMDMDIPVNTTVNR